eukprot:CAMPEP_0184675298 /NCGR_PEP_ID=MMETSP0308-20130426/87713_1 /TAXON_ID=38269 /ORGANISM="Gloeochaete witrockiana, Strain SAG 46.84" /LENGTH=136 /DNA_ID=CAMNT_0027122991 /DNA_START=1320 /DNA_END=1727 /DNA_ORIENTATION=-
MVDVTSAYRQLLYEREEELKSKRAQSERLYGQIQQRQHELQAKESQLEQEALSLAELRRVVERDEAELLVLKDEVRSAPMLLNQQAMCTDIVAKLNGFTQLLIPTAGLLLLSVFSELQYNSNSNSSDSDFAQSICW